MVDFLKLSFLSICLSTSPWYKRHGWPFKNSPFCLSVHLLRHEATVINDWALKQLSVYLSIYLFPPDITIAVDWALKFSSLSICLFPSDITVMVDWALKFSNLSIQRPPHHSVRFTYTVHHTKSMWKPCSLSALRTSKTIFLLMPPDSMIIIGALQCGQFISRYLPDFKQQKVQSAGYNCITCQVQTDRQTDRQTEDTQNQSCACT